MTAAEREFLRLPFSYIYVVEGYDYERVPLVVMRQIESVKKEDVKENF